MEATVIEKYLRICSIAGGMEKVRGHKELCSRLSAELEDTPAQLDNLFYENLGMSGNDLLEALARGWA